MFAWHKSDPTLSVVANFLLSLRAATEPMPPGPKRARLEEVDQSLSRMLLGDFKDEDRMLLRDFLRDIQSRVTGVE